MAQLPVKPFIIETAFLMKDAGGVGTKWRYTPLTLVDTITPLVSSLLFVALFFVK